MKKVRRYDIDWVRVIVFDILILYHVGMFFVPWDWHIKNNEIVEWFTWPMLLVNQWRIPILFVVSGMGTRFALSHRSGKEFALERFKRLFIPLVFGMLLIVPPQVYFERLSQGAAYVSYVDYYFFDAFKGIYPKGNISWNHLWFLPYLFLMSLVAIPLFKKLRTEDNTVIEGIQRRIESNHFLLFTPIFPLFLIDLFLEGSFPITHALIGDWYALVYYFTLFVFGFILVRLDDAFWKAVEGVRFAALILGIIALPMLIWLWYNLDPSIFIPIVRQINTWSWILAVFGFASKYLNKESEIVKYRNRAVYPFYILHQTVTIIIGYQLMDSPLHYGWKFLIMATGTFGICLIIYEFLIKRIKFLHPLFGVK